MTSRTHIPIGVITALAVAQPATIPGCMCAIAGGAIGGLFPDIDNAPVQKKYNISEKEDWWQLVVYAVLGIGAFFGLDYIFGDGACNYIYTNFGIPMGIAIVIFIGLCIFGLWRTSGKQLNPHRTFMHSLLACILFTVCVWFICRPISIAFGLGFISHILIDIVNKTGVQYFWPIKTKICLKWCDSNGKTNRIVGTIAILMAISVSMYYLVPSFTNTSLFSAFLNVMDWPVSIFGLFDLPLFETYLIGINIITFIVYLFDFYIGALFYLGNDSTEEFIHTLLLVFPLAGGAVGMLIAVSALIFSHPSRSSSGKLKKGLKSISKSSVDNDANTNLFLIPIRLMIFWILIYLIIRDPFNLLKEVRLVNTVVGGLPIVYWIGIYYLLINIITYIVYATEKQFAAKITAREVISLALAYIGGAAGGYLSMGINNKMMDAYAFSGGLPLVFTLQSVFISYLLNYHF